MKIPRSLIFRGNNVRKIDHRASIQKRLNYVIYLFVVAKIFRTQLFHGRNSVPDRGGFLFLCQEQSTDKNKFISTGCAGTPFRQMQS
jgi:hypothetical protein